MVRKKTALSKFGFTLIELIFAIVVMSIVVMTLPVMMQAVSKNIEDNLVQEAIFAASAELMSATTFYWDLNSTNDFNQSNLSRVIDISGNCENNISSQRHRLKLGHIAQPFHRRCLDSTGSTTADTSSTLFPNLNNSVKTDQDIFEDTVDGTPNAEAQGYKKRYTVTVTINKNDIDGTANPNIKEITATILDPDDNNITALRTYSANIGEVDYYKRRF